jgi:hypothetical protein
VNPQCPGSSQPSGVGRGGSMSAASRSATVGRVRQEQHPVDPLRTWPNAARLRVSAGRGMSSQAAPRSPPRHDEPLIL